MRAALAKIFQTSLLAFALAGAASDAQAGATEDAVLAEVNFARAHPQDYARRLAGQPVTAWEHALAVGGAALDPAAYAEAVDFLMRQAPLPPLRADDQLAAAALDHVAEQGPVGAVGHEGAGGEPFDARIRRHGAQAEILAENIAYGPVDPADVVRELIIDNGVAGRGHRQNIFNEGLDAAGVSCGVHRDYEAMCVMDFAGAPLAAPGWRQAELTLPAHGGGFLARLLHGR